MYRLSYFFIIFLAMLHPSFADIYNPQPEKGDLTLPAPNDATMAFRPVYIDAKKMLFGNRKFKLGDPNEGFREYRTAVLIGGTFIGGEDDWMYYMGKYEVTEAQYYAVMGIPEGEQDKDILNSQYPISNISWFEANRFIDQYNRWLFENAMDSLPKYQNIAGFVRLPTEVEWEFAARGGILNKDRFDLRQPYTENLNKYEWFFGPKSSHGKKKPIGMKDPNPLNIYDMLGNVSKMTFSLYQIEYYQGRNGGFVSKGGHYNTPEEKIRSSLRNEESFYNPQLGYGPNRKEHMGLRLVIVSVVYPSRKVIRDYSDAWDEYRNNKEKGAMTPAALSVGTIGDRVDAEKEDAFIHFDRLKLELEKNGNIPDIVKQELGLLQNSLVSIDNIRRKAAEDSAFAWWKVAGERAFFIYHELQKLTPISDLIQMAKEAGMHERVDRFQLREAEILQNISEALGTYAESFEQLDNIMPNAISAGFDKYNVFLVDHNAPEQLHILEKVKKHYDKYHKTKRVSSEQWRKDLSTTLN